MDVSLKVSGVQKVKYVMLYKPKKEMPMCWVSMYWLDMLAIFQKQALRWSKEER